MKKLFLILFLFVISCAGSTNKESAPETDSVRAELTTVDPDQFMAKTMEVPIFVGESDQSISKSIGAPVPVVLPETISVQKDTNIKKKAVEKRALDISKLDTTSFVPELKANIEKINYQQKQLDSLLTRKKK